MVARGPHGFRAALQQEDLPGAIDGPFDVLWTAVVLFDFARDVPQRSQFFIADARSVAKLFRIFQFDRASAGGRSMAHVLVAKFSHGNFSGDFSDDEAIRRDLAADHGRAEAPGAFDGD